MREFEPITPFALVAKTMDKINAGQTMTCVVPGAAAVME